MADAVQQLDYASTPPWHRRPLVRRIVIAAGFLCVAGAFALVAPLAWEHVQILTDQRRCLSHAAPSSVAIYKADAGAFGTIPEFWPRFYSGVSGSGLTSRATVFLHERIDSDGVRWLVAADLVTADVPEGGALAVHFRQFEPGSLFTRPRERIAEPREPLPIDKPTEVFAGQADPKDLSHFWFEYEMDGSRKRIDCWLTSEGVKAFEGTP